MAVLSVDAQTRLHLLSGDEIRVTKSPRVTNLLCVDKTGTLTTGAILAEGFELVDGSSPQPVEEVLGALAATEERPNATLYAIGSRWQAPAGWEASRTVPFSSARKWSGAEFGSRGTGVLGAPAAGVSDSEAWGGEPVTALFA